MASSPIDLPPTLESHSRVGQRLYRTVYGPLKGVAFWTAVALPFLHVPLLLATGLSSQPTTMAFVALLALNVVALLVGHPHSRS